MNLTHLNPNNLQLAGYLWLKKMFTNEHQKYILTCTFLVDSRSEQQNQNIFKSNPTLQILK